MKESVARPKGPQKKIFYKDDFELCYLRHKYLREVKFNPTKEQMDPYRGIVNKFARKTYYNCLRLFQAIGFEVEDVISIGEIHIVSFLGLFALERSQERYDRFVEQFHERTSIPPNSDDVLGKNKADFTIFLKQRMQDTVRVCRQKVKNMSMSQLYDFMVFTTNEEPPQELLPAHKYVELGYREMDAVTFISIRSKMKNQPGPIYKLNNNYYICVPTKYSCLTVFDLKGAGYNPEESLHHLNPEQIMQNMETEVNYEKKKQRYLKSTKKHKRKKLRDFVLLHKDKPLYNEEVQTALKLLKKL